MILPTIFRTKFKIRIAYKSGNVHEFWCTKFNMKNGKWEWVSVSQVNQPLLISINDVESVWQIGGRLNIFVGLWQLLTPPYWS